MLPIKYMEVEIIACPTNKKDEEANFFCIFLFCEIFI